MNLQSKKIAVIGLGYVGLPLSVEFGKITSVLGFDINQSRISALQAGLDATHEISSQELISAKYLEFTSDSEQLRSCDIFIITVPTPIDKVSRPELSQLKKASEMVGRAMRESALVIYESTVYPGCTEEICVPILEAASGLKFNEGFFCGYSPERINPGDRVNTIINVKKITSGSTPEIADRIDLLYQAIIKAGTYRAGSIRVAEAAKVIENSQRDLNIAFVNELSIIFARLGIDTMEVLEAAGSKWNFLPFRPGMVGGHCIGVDPYYLTHKAQEVGYHPQVILAGRRINDNMARYAARCCIRLMLKNGINVVNSTVGVLGITFKENCTDIRNSKVVDLILELNEWNANVMVVDPWADPKEVKNEYGITLSQLSQLKSLDCLIVAVGHDEFRSMNAEQLKSLCNDSLSPVLGDLKSLYPRHELTRQGFSVFRL